MKRYLIHFLFLLYFLQGCKPASQTKDAELSAAEIAASFKLIDSAKLLIKSGDIIFRNGRDEVSRAARSMNRKDTSFSHCGLLFIEHDSVFVYHAIGGIYNPGQRLRREPIDSFCAPNDNNAFGIYRYNLNKEQDEKLQSVVTKYYQTGLQFDLYFNYQSDDVMYCSEFVFKSLDKAADGSFNKYVRLDTIPFGVTTDDIFLNENCHLVIRKRFTR